MPRKPRRPLTAGLLALCLLHGCTQTGEQRISESEAARIRRSAEFSNAVPVQMLLTVGTPRDSDGNRYVDTIPIVVYLFPEASESSLPVWSRGRFEFELRSSTGDTISRWVFSEDIAAGARVSMSPGPGYSFFLRLAPGLDTRIEGRADLHGFFTHENGPVAGSNGAASVRLGNHSR
ncbi:MAG: hypothetical protein ACF8Q5_11490 [Phycisphaerales bacterium JB040]